MLKAPSYTYSSLNFLHPLTYATDNFLIHAGIKEPLAQLEHYFTRPFSINSIFGSKRSGKSHFAVFLTGLVGSRGWQARLISGRDFKECILELTSSSHSLSDLVIVVDDADLYLSKLSRGSSGELVSLFERLRIENGRLVLIRETDWQPPHEFDDHVASRLLLGTHATLQDPGQEDIAPLVDLLAWQRGLKVSPKKLRFIASRMPPSVGGIEEYVNRLVTLTEVTAEKITYRLLSDALAKES